MKSEIGSEFWNIPICSKENALFPKNVHWFLSGRGALKAIIAENSFKTAAIPFWCCDSIIAPFVDAGISVEFYRNELPKTDVAIVMDFFGYTGHSSFDNFEGIIIRDVTHSLFSITYYDADYYFGSLRKWAGFWTGGYAWGFKNKVEYLPNNTQYIELRRRAMELKSSYINREPMSNGMLVTDKKFLRMFNKAEQILDNNSDIYLADSKDINNAKYLNVEYIKKSRRENSMVLMEAFPELLVFKELKELECPLFVPIKVKERDALRKYLIQNNIYCPVHWPIVASLHKLKKEEVEFYNEELSLVCDQRYNKEDMLRIVNAIKDFYKEGM